MGHRASVYVVAVSYAYCPCCAAINRGPKGRTRNANFGFAYDRECYYSTVSYYGWYYRYRYFVWYATEGGCYNLTSGIRQASGGHGAVRFRVTARIEKRYRVAF